MLSKNKVKYIKSLQDKKNRNEFFEFLVEWEKSIIDLINSDFEILDLIISEMFYNKHKKLFEWINFEITSQDEITNISSLKTNSYGVALVKQKENLILQNNLKEIVLVLDDIKDPWNFWTIIRIADWYGITKIICSNDTVELYNPKTIISSMWSFCRVWVYYTDLKKYLENTNLPIYWAFINWENIHKTELKKPCFLVIGNESNWISRDLESIITKKITIPKFWQAESLNAWIATSVILDNFFRNF